MTDKVTWRDYGPAIQEIGRGLFVCTFGVLAGILASGADTDLMYLLSIACIFLLIDGGFMIRDGIRQARIYRRFYKSASKPNNVMPFRRG